MNPRINYLQPYPFQRLRQLIAGINPPPEFSPIRLEIGEPHHAPPPFIADTWLKHHAELAQYPATKGAIELRTAISNWLINRFQISAQYIDPERNCLPVAGTREALFSFAQAVINPQRIVVMPNPFYQIYEGAALLAGAQPWFINTSPANDFLPDFNSVPIDIWQRCQLIYICSPSNPSGAVFNLDHYATLLELSDRYNFIIAADECYSEIYRDTPPLGLLQACVTFGRNDFHQCVVFHSLSKRSNVPGLRSGFVAGDAKLLEQFLLYRTYHGCALPLPTQAASAAAWNDETHVLANRALYQRKFIAVEEILHDVLDIKIPPAGFYLWPEIPRDSELFTRELYAATNVLVLPGSYLARTAHGINPGENRVRVALVADYDNCRVAAGRIRDFLRNS